MSDTINALIARGRPIDIGGDFVRNQERARMLAQRDTALAQDQQQIDYRNALMQRAQAEQDQQTQLAAQREHTWDSALSEVQRIYADSSLTPEQKLQAARPSLMTAYQNDDHNMTDNVLKVWGIDLQPQKVGQLYQTSEGFLPADKAVGKMPYQAPQRAPIQGPTSDMQNFEYFRRLTPEQQAAWSQVNGGARGVVGGVDPLTGDGLDIAAETYRTTGKLPTGLYRVPGATIKVINRAAELALAAGDNAQATILRQQSFNANKTAMAAVRKQQAQVGAFEKTAEKNLGLVLSLSDQLSRSDIPLLNRAIVNFRQNITGDPKTASFVNALIAARTEYAKVLSGATGAQGITDSARREAEDLFSKASTPDQLRAVVATARQEMANRMSSFEDQMRELQVMPGSESQATAPTAKPTKTVTRTGTLNGRKVVQYSDGTVEYGN